MYLEPFTREFGDTIGFRTTLFRDSMGLLEDWAFLSFKGSQQKPILLVRFGAWGMQCYVFGSCCAAFVRRFGSKNLSRLKVPPVADPVASSSNIEASSDGFFGVCILRIVSARQPGFGIQQLSMS